MKDTNAIEKALKDKCQQEISKVVDVFINDLKSKLEVNIVQLITMTLLLLIMTIKLNSM